MSKAAEAPRTLTKGEALARIIEGMGNETSGQPKGIRSRELAERAGINQANLCNYLAAHVKSGRIAVARVDTIKNGATYSTNEYRKGCGVPLPDFTPLRTTGLTGTRMASRIDARMGAVAAPAPQPAVGQNTGSRRPDPSSLKTPSGAPADTARTVEPTPPAVRERRGMGPAPALPVAGAALRLSINQDGELQLGDEEDPARLVFAPAQVLAIGDFLHATKRVWRP